MTYTELVEIDLTDDERSFMQTALNEWGGPASYAPLPITILGLTSWDEFDNLVDRLSAAIGGKTPLSDLDWARALFLTEISWASDLVGSGMDFALIHIRDEEAVQLLRAIQRKVSTSYRADLLFPNAGRPSPPPFDYEAFKRLHPRPGDDRTP
jgi:hypothetical protein